MSRSYIGLAGLWLFLSACSLAAGSKTWIEVDSPHFHVFTDGGQSHARQVAFKLEQLRYVFASQFPKVRLDSGAPLFVFAADNKESAWSLLPYLKKTKGGRSVAGEYFHGWEKQYAMVRLDAPDVEPVYHEYVHSILHINALWLPTWLDEGLAEFYGFTRFEKRDVYLGAPSVRAPLLRGNTLIPIEQLISSGPKPSEGLLHVNIFYAEAWALVHYMTFGPDMQGGARLAHFFSLVQNGEDQKTAFRQVFGGFKEMDSALRKYVDRFAFPAADIKTPPTIDEKNFTVRMLSAAETDAQLAAFHIWTHDVSDAVPLAKAAVAADSKLGLAHEDMGYTLFSQGQDAAAEKEFDRAYSLNGSLYLSLFAKTMLSPIARSSTPADESQFQSALEKVVELNPQFAPAYVELALLANRQNDLPKAFTLSRRAEALEPARAGYHILTGRILLRMGRGAEAAQFAKFVADRWEGPDHDEAVELWTLVPAAQRPSGELISINVPVGLQPATGTIKSVTCSPGPAKDKIILQTSAGPLTFQMGNNFTIGFSDTLWYGEDHFTLCHHLDGLRAFVLFKPLPGDAKEGNFIDLEIRDNFPAQKLNPAPAPAQQASN
jgi:tetratricopeptide (TPR) repeat protein